MKLLLFLFLLGCTSTQSNCPTYAMSDLIVKINDMRSDQGLEPLSVSENLNCAASLHAADIGFNRRCDHIGSDATTFAERAELCDVKVVDQIIACGPITPEDALKTWKRKISIQALTDPDYWLIGCGMHNYYWVCTFSY